MDYVIGLDAGATKSHLALFDIEGHKRDFRTYGPLNHEVLPGSYEQLERELLPFVRQFLSDNNVQPKQVACGMFGMAGVDTRRQHGIVSAMLDKLSLRDVLLTNDSFLGIPAAIPSCIGLCAINGTGCTLAGIDRKGAMLQIGGLGLLTRDLGGGGQIGVDVAGLAYSALFRRGEPTLLSQLVMGELGIQSKYDFLESISAAAEVGNRRLGTLNRLAFLAAEQGDKVALELLDRMAANYAGGLLCLLDELDFDVETEVPVVLIGSVFTKGESPVLIDGIKSKVARGGGHTHFVVLQKPPVAGAVVWALERAGAGQAVCETALAEF